jgi:hypothetical protein
MIPNRFYMHKNCLDVFIEPIFIDEIFEKQGIIGAVWHNLGYIGQPWLLNDETELVHIKNAADWIDITDKVYNKRTASGLPT